ncbi:MAG TPA: nucleotidyltransferase [Vicinamibacterales bacterium]
MTSRRPSTRGPASRLSSVEDPYTGPVDATPALVEIGRALGALDFEAVLIGNAAAALQGAPVTTVDFDFFFRNTSRNLAKLKALADRLKAVILRPYYPASDLYRVVRDDDGLQVDFMATIHGIRSFKGVYVRATLIEIDDVTIRVASLADIIRSKKAARRPRDLAVLGILEKALEATRQKNKAGSGRAGK